MWAYINVSDWSEVRFGSSSGLPKNFLNYSIIWSNTTHAQVLVYVPSSGTYYLYWQPLEQVPYANITNPFYVCYNGICGVRFNGLNQYAQSWTAKNWLTSNASSIVWQFYLFPNQTETETIVLANSPYLQILQGQITTDSTNGWTVFYVPSTVSGYVAQVNLPNLPGVAQFTTFLRGDANTNNVLRYELYENGVLINSFTRGTSTGYTWAQSPWSFIIYPGKKYTV
jgi:hypothetical protein